MEIVNEYPRVYEQSLFTKKEWIQKTVETHKAIVNEAREPIAVVGKNYKVVQDADVMPQFHDVIMKSNLDKTGMTKKISYSHNGAN